MTQQEWDKEIAPELQRIESYSRLAGDAVRRLPMRPAWLTKAEVELDDLERELMTAIKTIRSARETYRHKPVMMEAAE